jgi:hypothetical protein
MTEIIFDICQRHGGHVWYNVLRDLIIEKWQTIVSDLSTTSFGTLCKSNNVNYYYFDSRL